jgi:hypothetical protein
MLASASPCLPILGVGRSKKGSRSERKGSPGKLNDQAFVLTVH